MRRSLIIVTSLACLALGWPCAADDIASPIVGLWKLTGTTTKNVATGAMERPYGERPSGVSAFHQRRPYAFHQRRREQETPVCESAHH